MKTNDFTPPSHRNSLFPISAWYGEGSRPTGSKLVAACSFDAPLDVRLYILNNENNNNDYDSLQIYTSIKH